MVERRAGFLGEYMKPRPRRWWDVRPYRCRPVSVHDDGAAARHRRRSSMNRRLSVGFRRLPLAVIGGLLLVLALLAPVAAQAADAGEAGGKFRTGDSVEVRAGETFDDNLYAFAGTIEVDGTLDGDLVAAGGSISIDGTVTGDVTVTGGQLTVNGEVGGDIRFAGGQLQVDGPVEGDIAVVGGSVDLDGDVGSDVLFGAGQVNIGGDVAGQIYGGAGDYDRTGTVVGPEDVTVDVGEDEEPTVADRALGGLYRFIALFLVGALVLLVLRRPLETVLTRARQRPGASLLFGLIALAAVAALLVVSIVLGIIWSIAFGLSGLGLLVGTYWFVIFVMWVLVAFALFLLVVYAAPIVTAMTGARLVLAGRDNVWVQLGALALGLVVYLAVTAIPFVGWLIGAVAVVLAAGAIVLATRNFRVSTVEPVTSEP
jgi:cytoskeletal protein CcmA (bactofilin family)